MNEHDIFLAALDFPDSASRSAYLDRICADDPALRDRVEALLRSHTGVGSFHGTHAAGPTGRPGESSATTSHHPPRDPDDDDGEDDVDLGFLAPSARPDSLGRIGHYEVLQVLGCGAFGIVFRAFDDVLQRVVAVKVLAPPLAATSPARKRFLREARSSAKVRHPNVVQVYAVEEQPLPYLVMEYIPGTTLQHLLDQTGPLEGLEVAVLARQIALGLSAAHATGLVHRDIKPANILLEMADSGSSNVPSPEGAPPSGQLAIRDLQTAIPRITDFGLARTKDDASVTQSGIVVGTPMYMAPEQALGLTLDHRGDLFSLGSVLYALCTGHPPFRAESALAILQRVVQDTPRPIREVIPEVPEWLCKIIEKLHAKKPEARFASAQELADVLGRHLAGEVSTELRPQEVRREKPPARRRAVLAAGLVLLAVVGLGEVSGTTNLRGIMLRLFSPSGGVNLPVGDAPVVGEPTDWEKSVAALPPEQQREAVIARLRQVNPDLRGKIEPYTTLSGGPGLEITGPGVRDLSPLRVLAELRGVTCVGDNADLTDLASLRGLRLADLKIQNASFGDLLPLAEMKLEHLDCTNCPKVTSLQPLRGMPLTVLSLPYTSVTDLSPLVGMHLEYLNLEDTKVADLTPLKGMPLSRFRYPGTRVEDVAVLQDMPLTEVHCDFQPARDGQVLRAIKSLQTINDVAVEEFWKRR